MVLTGAFTGPKPIVGKYISPLAESFILALAEPCELLSAHFVKVRDHGLDLNLCPTQ